jgi:hypothetical protein
MNHNDSFEAETICGTELQNGGKSLKESSRITVENILERQQMPSFIRGDDSEDAADLF